MEVISNVDAKRSVVRSIAWLDADRRFKESIILMMDLFLEVSVGCKCKCCAAGELEPNIASGNEYTADRIRGERLGPTALVLRKPLLNAPIIR